ncbi:damage-inducible protein DinB [Hymenobacter sp. 5317J-9]|uniref:DinB family protein n=1 Tax=Hymenobacter sp. 5317J-9 TaxID=2932250 RepID=UPI001FD66A5E|nr:DinB family protein [Hymenobacter sp. 5317J-9]UOQ98122.1 damage-inducible protein DinB [Hymenobacter sp. 5317J-9]
MNTLEKLGAFNVWANDTVLNRLDEIAASGQEIPAVVLRLFSHVLNAQAIWISRINGVPSPVKVWQEHDLPTLHRLHEQASDPLHQLMVNADETELQRLISYTNSLGDSYDSLVHDILTHAVVHASYHRAQVATRLRDHGFEPVNSDFITYCRELSAAAQTAVPSL